jgi:tetratricopeptide (TPR) repeat protein/NAD-dependent dihydropyrimidine dehydrogenase PreA subunit
MGSIPRNNTQTQKNTLEKHSIKCGTVRASKRGIIRASILILVHILILIHIAQWLITGHTMTPLEPSEAMQTLELGYINAGFILFILAILATLIFGRFFCGWACHVVAYQDFCGWIMRKLGKKPKPFRSRLLVYVPLFAALYMFVWPQVLRIWEGRPFPPLVYHLTTQHFWDTFPGFWIGALTFIVCGGLMVYLLGNKGFCTYGCPYGGFFAPVDRLASGKIRVTDACEQCGHCTTACTSNVRVHEEVNRYGMVVDPGCMKCMDCVSVCPKNALYFGFGKPSFAVKPNKPPKHTKKYDFTVSEELVMAVVFIFSFYAFRGLYDAVPLLLSIALSGITAYIMVCLIRVIRRKNVRLQRTQLSDHGRITKQGALFIVFSVLLFGFLVHSVIWQYHWHQANAMIAQLREKRNRNDDKKLEQMASVTRSHLEWCSNNGLFATAAVEINLGDIALFMNDFESAVTHLRNAIKLGAQGGEPYYWLAQAYGHLGKTEDAIRALKKSTNVNPDLPGVRKDLAFALIQVGKNEEAIEQFRILLKNEHNDIESLIIFATLLSQEKQHQEAIHILKRAIEQHPNLPHPYFVLGSIYVEIGNYNEALRHLTKSASLQPDHAATYTEIAKVELIKGNHKSAIVNAEKARTLAPYDRELLLQWANLMDKTSFLQTKINELVQSNPQDDASWYAVTFLYKQKGDEKTANSLFMRLLSRNPQLTPP